ncbi:glycosyltransferase family 4 protein [Flavobacterium sp.]
MGKTTIVFLYREVMPYNITVFRELVKKGCTLHVVQDDSKKLTPYVPIAIEGVSYYNRSAFSQQQLMAFVLEINPDILYISDRTIAMYNSIGILFKKKNVPVVSGNDTPWYGGKQWLNVFTSFFRHRRFFSHMLVAGMRQFEYAKKLGFANDKILFPLYSADVSNFEALELNQERFQDAKNLLFVGRYNKVKGLDLLIEAWKQVENKNGARLIVVGNGNLLDNIAIPDDVVLKGFSSQTELLEISKTCKGFVLPSIFEPWGVVIHEFAAGGFPLIVTDVCGATPHLAINNHNGFIISHNDTKAIAQAITKLFELSASELYEMGRNSRKMSKSITPELVAAAILSTLKN